MISIVTYLWDDPLLEASNEKTIPRTQERVRLNRKGKPVRMIVTPPTRSLTTPIGAQYTRTIRAFKPEYVVRLAQLFRKHLTLPHRFVCVADEPGEEGQGVDWVQTPPESLALGALRSPEGGRFPSCYRRLWSFSEAAKALGDTILVIDIDLVPVGNLDHLFRGDEDFMGWRPYRDWGRKLRFGGGIYRLKTGTRTEVWNDFKGASSIHEARVAGFRGSDQAWISHKLAHKEPYFSRAAGIYSIRDLGNTHNLPPDARLVQFNGHVKQWGYNGPAEWVARAWKGA